MMRFLRFTLTLFVAAAACTTEATSQAPSTTQLPLVDVLDGAVHPEFISDDLALSVWLLAVCETSSANSDAVARMHAKLNAVGLQPSDRLALSEIVTHFADVRETFKQREQTLADLHGSLGEQQRQQLGADHQTLFAQTKSAVMSGLSAQGKQSFTQHLSRLKEHIRVGQGPQM